MLSLTLDATDTVAAETREASTSDFDALVAALVAQVDRLAGAGANAVGIGVAGMVDRDGVVVASPNLPGLVDVPLQAAVSERVDVAVVVDNDANVAALAEARLGVARGHSHVLMVTLGTGIGGGWVVDGAIQRGAHGFLGEIGHFTVDAAGPVCACGERGHWESIASGRALTKMAEELEADGRGSLASRAESDTIAQDLLDRFATAVVTGLAGLCNIFDPSIVVLGGGVVEIGEALVSPIVRRLGPALEGGAQRPTVPVRAAALGERANAVGAALLAREILV